MEATSSSLTLCKTDKPTRQSPTPSTAHQRVSEAMGQSFRTARTTGMYSTIWWRRTQEDLVGRSTRPPSELSHPSRGASSRRQSAHRNSLYIAQHQIRSLDSIWTKQCRQHLLSASDQQGSVSHQQVISSPTSTQRMLNGTTDRTRCQHLRAIPNLITRSRKEAETLAKTLRSKATSLLVHQVWQSTPTTSTPTVTWCIRIWGRLTQSRIHNSRYLRWATFPRVLQTPPSRAGFKVFSQREAQQTLWSSSQISLSTSRGLTLWVTTIALLTQGKSRLRWPRNLIWETTLSRSIMDMRQIQSSCTPTTTKSRRRQLARCPQLQRCLSQRWLFSQGPRSRRVAWSKLQLSQWAVS